MVGVVMLLALVQQDRVLGVVALQEALKALLVVKRVLPNGVKVLAVVKQVVDGAAILREVVLMAAEQ